MRGTRLWLLLGLCAALLVGLVAAGCGGDGDDEDTILIGIDTPYPPFEIGKPPDVTGYDIEVMDAIMKEVGKEPEYQDTSFDTIFRDVASGKFETAAAATTITPGRQETVSFTDPYYEADQAVVVAEGNTDVTSADDLDGTIIGAQDATTGETYANDEVDATEVRGFPEGPDAINAVRGGQVDVAIIDQPVALDAVEEQGGVEIVDEIPTGELYGFAVSKDNTDLLDDMNKALVKLKEDGTIADLYEKYFELEPPKSVLDGTTENP